MRCVRRTTFWEIDDSTPNLIVGLGQCTSNGDRVLPLDDQDRVVLKMDFEADDVMCGISRRCFDVKNHEKGTVRREVMVEEFIVWAVEVWGSRVLYCMAGVVSW